MIWHKNAHLGRSWSLLRASWGDLGASWAELGPIWAAKRSQKGGQKGPKRRQKRDQNDIKILIDFWTDFGAIWEAQGTQLRRALRNARGLARLFEFEEFEQEFEEDFENESRHAPTLRVAADLIAQRAVRRAG